jgi:DNA excision repair protein ERCC-4
VASAAQLPALPALRSLGDLADARPIILIDSREQDPLQFEHLASQTSTLQSGDYSLLGASELFSVERKTVADFVGCCVGDNRDRFARELHRLRGFHFKRLLIIGTESEIREGKYRSNIKPQSVLGTLSAFEVRYEVPVVFCATPQIAACQIERWCFYFARQLVESVNELRRGVGSAA